MTAIMITLEATGIAAVTCATISVFSILETIKLRKLTKHLESKYDDIFDDIYYGIYHDSKEVK